MARSGMVYLDSPKRVHIEPVYTATTTWIDWTWMSYKKGKYIYALDSVGTSFYRISPTVNADLKSYGITFPTPDVEKQYVGLGITNDRKDLYIYNNDAFGLSPDSIVANTIQGALIGEIALSDSPFSTDAKLVYFRHEFYVQRGTVCYVYSMSGQLDRQFNLTAGAAYGGITQDGKHLWFVRTDGILGGGSIEQWGEQGNIIQRFANPDGGLGATYQKCITHNRRYNILLENLTPPVDIE